MNGFDHAFEALFNQLPLPDAVRQLLTMKVVLMLISMGLIIGFISVLVLFLIWLERKISARIQRRMGPMTSGPSFLRSGNMWFGGLLQTAADAIKLLTKETVTPADVDYIVFVLAPCIVFAASLMAYVVIPFGPDASVSDLNVGVLYLLAVGSMTVLGIMMAGWGSNSKYSLLGGLRSVAQMISYEIPMIFAVLGPVLMAGSLSLQEIIQVQERTAWFIWPNIIGFVVFIIAGTAETNRPPFDLPEGESELVAGFVTEYSGMQFAMFFLAEFSNMFVISAVAAALFLGGWSLPFGITQMMRASGMPHVLFSALGAVVFLTKTLVIVLILMWVRWTFPRVRVDQLMHFGWKTLLPFSFVNLLIAAVYMIAYKQIFGEAVFKQIFGAMS
ncbi:MAG: NADH-quinone oxidoreductase subunit NuoH [Proteobacteria bacterium]|nr:NADH-quinone oxidoreductase subunit NuoH [Pseudomonadota bacterium]